eukprot:scaffold5939_cov67-Phaeocystis_antarctica.AAC.1
MAAAASAMCSSGSCPDSAHSAWARRSWSSCSARTRRACSAGDCPPRPPRASFGTGSARRATARSRRLSTQQRCCP